MSELGADLSRYAAQTIGEDDIEAVVATLRGGWLTTGPAVQAFESAFAADVKAEHAVSCTSGTAALHLAMAALGLTAGDWVVVPSLTFLASANAARFVGAEVAFADVDPTSGLMRPSDLEAALARIPAGRAKAVVTVDLNGQCAHSAEIRDAAAAAGLHVVEDACHALGADYRSGAGAAPVRVGSCAYADMTVFSLHPAKIITCGEGGVVTANAPMLAQSLRRLRNHGIVREPDQFTLRDLAFDESGTVNVWHYEMEEIGYNYRLSDINCALGLSQLKKLDRFVERRSRVVAQYDRALESLAPKVRTIARNSDCTPAWHLYPVLIDFSKCSMGRNALMGKLRERGIGTQVHYIPVHRQPYYVRRYGALDLPGADAYYEHVLSLPLFPTMADDDPARVAAALGELLA